MRKGIVIGGAVVVLAAAAAAMVLPRMFQKEEVTAEVSLPVVEVQSPKLGTIELKRELVGQVEPSDVVYLYPKMAGEVTQVYVKAGETVYEGQPICDIDTKQVENARLSLEAAEQSLRDAQTNLSRQQALFSAGDISSAVYEQAQTQATNARINYDTAKLNYDNQVEYSHITATISGKVEICDVEVHDNVSAQNLIAVISGEGSKSVTFSVPEKIADQLHPGDAVTIEKNGREYVGTVNEVSSMIDAATGLFKIKASVENGDALPTGSSAKLYVTSDKQENVMTIPVDSVYYSGGDAYVYTYDNGTVHQVPVEVGIYDSQLAQILSGISMSDQVITTWSSELYEGSQVAAAENGGNGETSESSETGAAAPEAADGQDSTPEQAE
ncbi:MAG TPA: efflux RND transporter periplasmic adaptor subunit [Candidatus Ventrimonas merdavium]|nr:efflux RND transporter periplasmic adaptor subunit [Candidatus Ventrimonas merdavium]